jgi:hypothetical protein
VIDEVCMCMVIVCSPVTPLLGTCGFPDQTSAKSMLLAHLLFMACEFGYDVFAISKNIDVEKKDAARKVFSEINVAPVVNFVQYQARSAVSEFEYQLDQHLYDSELAKQCHDIMSTDSLHRVTLSSMYQMSVKKWHAVRKAILAWVVGPTVANWEITVDEERKGKDGSDKKKTQKTLSFDKFYTNVDSANRVFTCQLRSGLKQNVHDAVEKNRTAGAAVAMAVTSTKTSESATQLSAGLPTMTPGSGRSQKGSPHRPSKSSSLPLLRHMASVVDDHLWIIADNIPTFVTLSYDPIIVHTGLGPVLRLVLSASELQVAESTLIGGVDTAAQVRCEKSSRSSSSGSDPYASASYCSASSSSFGAPRPQQEDIEVFNRVLKQVQWSFPSSCLTSVWDKRTVDLSVPDLRNMVPTGAPIVRRTGHALFVVFKLQQHTPAVPAPSTTSQEHILALFHTLAQANASAAPTLFPTLMTSPFPSPPSMLTAHSSPPAAAVAALSTSGTPPLPEIHSLPAMGARV